MRKLCLSFLFLSLAFMVVAQQEIPLYSGPIPNSKPGANREKVEGNHSYSLVSQPTLTIFLPSGGSKGAVVVCPGGGYTHLAMGHEGLEIAKMLNEAGYAAFVLKYRLPNDETMVDKTIGPLQDAQRAIQVVRERAKEWGVDAGKVGIMGFSAGGHLASTAGTHFGTAVIDNKSGVSLRPDFMILMYPVISFSDSIGHRGSRDALIGKSPAADKVQLYSNELQVTAAAPPAFIVHSEDDKTVQVANSIHMYESLLHNGVPAEMHLYAKGGHGYGLHNSTTTDQWSERLINWLNGLLAGK
ncbi:MAG: alpha/beta hydrolase [Bacteroidetes bacterium]|nr:alpha/beta hydrolase [Bacteroidota bacterium]